MLSDSWMVCILLLLFQMAMSYGTGIFYSSAFFVLVPAYNLSVTWVSASGYIFVLVSIYTMVGVGYYGDLIVSRFGKRKPLVLLGYVILCVASCFLVPLSKANLFASKSGNPDTDDGNGYAKDSWHNMLVPRSASMVRLEIWYLLCQVIAGFGYSIFTIPFNSWFFESSLNTQDYSKLQLYCINFGSNSGYLFAILTMYNYQRTCLALGAVVLTCGGLPLLLALMYCVHNEVVRDVHAPPARDRGENENENAEEQSLVSAGAEQGTVIRPLMLPSLRELFRDNKEFRKLLYNSVILNTGGGVVGEFVSYSPYILFPAIKHYKTLLTLATLFFFASLVAVVFLTALAKGWWLERCKMDKLVLFKRLILAFIAACVVAFFMNFPRIWEEAEPGANIGTDDAVPATETTNAAYVQIILYLAVQVCLSAMGGFALYLNLMLTRDVIRFDEYRTGMARYNMYQSALTIPPKILIGFLISMPQIIFYSSGYRTVEYDYSGGTGSDTYVTDDKIDHKWTWTVWSYYQLVFFQTVLAGLLGWAAYRVLANYSLTQPVVDRIDEVLTERSRRAKQHMSSGASVQNTTLDDAELDAPLIRQFSTAASEDLPLLSFAGDTRVLKLRARMTPEEENQLILHFSDYEMQLMASPDAWKSERIQTRQYRNQRGFSEPSVECVTPLLPSESNVPTVVTKDKDAEQTRLGVDGDSFLHYRNTGLETITFYHKLMLFVVSPAVLILLLYANYVHIWRRENSPFIPLTVNMFCMSTAYVFYEILRMPVIAELNSKMQGKSRVRTDSLSDAAEPNSESRLPNSVAKELLQGVLNRAEERLLYRVEDLHEMLNPSSASSVIDVDAMNLNVINIDYDPYAVHKKRPKRKDAAAARETETQEYTTAQGVTYRYSQHHYGGTEELTEPRASQGLEQAFVVNTDSPPQVVWMRGSVERRAFGGYGWVLVAFCLLVAFGIIFIVVI